jgi:hypothetical protein
MTVHAIKPPNASEQRRREVIAILEEALKEANEGFVDGVVLIALRTDGCWYPVSSSGPDFTSLVGKMEVFKQQLIAKYTQQEGVK